MGLPDYDDLPTSGGHRTSWSLWKDPRLGCLELLTPERVRSAASLVRRGEVFHLTAALNEFEPPLFGRQPLIHETRGRGSATDDFISQWNTQASSQWDGFIHMRDPELGYFGGLALEEHGIHFWAERGIVGRGLLVDAFRWRESVGRPLELLEGVIVADELKQILDAQKVSVEPGDILLLHTGWLDKYRKLDAKARADVATSRGHAGLANDEEMARTLWNLHVAAVASDNPALEAWPPVAPGQFLHFYMLARLGIPIGELWDLGHLAADCAADGVYEFMLTSAPLNLKGGAASPPNALAIK